MTNPALQNAMAEFVSAFEEVFRHDWDYTRREIIETLRDGQTFLDAGRRNDWKNGDRLHDAYERLLSEMLK